MASSGEKVKSTHRGYACAEAVPAYGEAGAPHLPAQVKNAPNNAALTKEGLRSNLSAVEATSQLKVLCRKFAALTEKVKEETRAREEAEKEVRRLRAIVDGNDAPVVVSSRAETQAYIKELKDVQEELRKELRLEKGKNSTLVAKALELENEKNELLTGAQSSTNGGRRSSAAMLNTLAPTSWDREQTSKIHDTLTTTIHELQDELMRKAEEIGCYRDRLYRERGQVKALEQEIRQREHAAREEQAALKELEASIHEQREQFEGIEKEMRLAEERLHEEATMRKTLEEQIDTLNNVNAALDQRTNALVRRLELSNSVVRECDELKLQLKDLEIDKETLVRTIKELKEQQFSREAQWKCQLDQLRGEKACVTTQIADLQSEITTLRAQNSLLSEWMLVRNNNTAVQKRDLPESPGRSREDREHPSPTAISHHHFRRESSANRSAPVRPLSDREETSRAYEYAHSSVRCPLSPPKTKSMTTASPIKQFWSHRSPRKTYGALATTSRDDPSDQREYPPSLESVNRRVLDTRRSSQLSSRISDTGSEFSKQSDHERLRLLMSRNRELQQRLQQETVATRNLEQEITEMTTVKSSFREV